MVHIAVATPIGAGFGYQTPTEGVVVGVWIPNPFFVVCPNVLVVAIVQGNQQ